MPSEQEKTLKDILETVTFLKDHGITKEESAVRLMEVKTDMANTFETQLTEAKTEIMSHVDSFVVLHQKLDTELTLLRSKYNRLESQIQLLAKHLNFALPE